MTETSGGSVETVKDDIGTSPADKWKRWKAEIDLAQKAVEKWHKAGEEVVRRYRDEERGRYRNEEHGSYSRFNILWANTETLKPALYGQSPTPDVRRRINDPKKSDPVGREVAIVLERGLSFSIDDYDFDGVMRQCVEDYLLPGRGNARVCYIPTMAMGEPPRVPIDSIEQDFDQFGNMAARRFLAGGQLVDEAKVQNVDAVDGLAAGEALINLADLNQDDRPFTLGEPVEEVVYEEARCEYVFWQDYLESPARIWDEVRWVAFRLRLTRAELRQQFPKVANDVTLDWVPKGIDANSEVAEFFKKATVWEIWDKDTKTVIPIAVGYNEGPLAEWDDPLELGGFFPNPKPLDFVSTNNSRIPIPVYKVYQDQAAELDIVTQRINKLISMLKVRGVYDKVEASLEHILTKGDGELVGIDNFAELAEKGGLDRVISFLPIEQIAKVLQGLYLQREQIKRTIHEITGLSDIIRGSTDPRETKGAQVLKAEFGSLRLQNPQGQVQRFARDLLRLKAEVMAEHFGEDTLRQISGIELPSEEERAQAQQQPDNPEAQKLLAKPTWQQVTALLRDDGARAFRIDIETDSTIQPDAGKAKQESVSMMQAIAGFMKEAMPVVQASPSMGPLMGQLLKLLLRQFKPGRLVEEAVDQALAQLEEAAQQPQADPEAAEKQAAEQKAQADAQEEQAKNELAKQEVDAKAEVEQAKQDFERQKHADEMAFKREQLEMTREIETGKILTKAAVDRDKIMAQHGPGIIEAMQQAQAGIGEAAQESHTNLQAQHQAMLAQAREASERNSAVVVSAMQALTDVTENLSAAIQTIGGPKRIVKNRKGEPVGIEPGVPEGTTLQ